MKVQKNKNKNKTVARKERTTIDSINKWKTKWQMWRDKETKIVGVDKEGEDITEELGGPFTKLFERADRELAEMVSEEAGAELSMIGTEI